MKATYFSEMAQAPQRYCASQLMSTKMCASSVKFAAEDKELHSTGSLSKAQPLQALPPFAKHFRAKMQYVSILECKPGRCHDGQEQLPASERKGRCQKLPHGRWGSVMKKSALKRFGVQKPLAALMKLAIPRTKN